MEPIYRLQINEAFVKTCAKVDRLHHSVEKFQDSATELVLKKACADVSKVVYTLRLKGDRLSEEGDLPALHQTPPGQPREMLRW